MIESLAAPPEDTRWRNRRAEGPDSEEADDGVRAQGCGETCLPVEGGRGLLIEDDDGAVLLRLVKQFGCVQGALAGAAAAVAVHPDSHAVIHPYQATGRRWTP